MDELRALIQSNQNLEQGLQALIKQEMRNGETFESAVGALIRQAEDQKLDTALEALIKIQEQGNQNITNQIKESEEAITKSNAETQQVLSPIADLAKILKGEARGPQGAQGDIGPQGMTGARGVQGPQGDTGPQGDQGPQGEQGEKGDTGDNLRFEDLSDVQVESIRGFKGDRGEQGPKGVQGPKGEKGEKGDKGDRGPEGWAGPQGPVGKGINWQGEWSAGTTYEKDDAVFYDSDSYIAVKKHSGQTPSPSSDFWDVITNAEEGAQGPQGPQGETGATGPQGDDGAQGPQGSSGPQGDDGAQGAQGPQGETGGSMSWQGTWATSTSYVVDDSIENDGSTYICIQNHTSSASDEPGTGASWETYWDLVAQKGDTGAQGAQGAQGDTGAQGPQGDDGAQGATGPQGETGAQGATGAQGDTGAQGPQGVQGATGDTGPQGETGAQGAQGAQGATGPQGDTGAQGAQGATGDTGPQGADGPQGATGAQGPQGDDGAQGAQGAQGATGEGVAAGGSQYQVLQKSSATDYDTDWTDTIQNTRINPRQDSQASTASITPNKANEDEYYRTAQAAAITINNATSPSVGDKFVVNITDNGTSQSISFGTDYVGVDGQALPTATTVSKSMEIIIKYVTATKAIVTYVEEA